MLGPRRPFLALFLASCLPGTTTGDGGHGEESAALAASESHLQAWEEPCSAILVDAVGAAAAVPPSWAGYYARAPAHWCGGFLTSVCGGHPAYYQHYCPNASALPDPSSCLHANFVYFTGDAAGGEYVLGPVLGSVMPGDWTAAAAPGSRELRTAAGAAVGQVRCVPGRRQPPRCELQPLTEPITELDARSPPASRRARWLPALVPAATAAAIVAAAEAQVGGVWSADRHAAYQTTDIDALATPGPLKTLVQKVVAAVTAALAASAHSAPELAAAAAAGISFGDVFVVKYEATGAAGQRSLALHADGSAVTFQLALNGDGNGSSFAGGGTYFKAMDCQATARVGSALVFGGDLLHAGVEITAGVRYLLVGFGAAAAAAASSGGPASKQPLTIESALHGVDFGPAFSVATGSSSSHAGPVLSAAGELQVQVWWPGAQPRGNFSLHARTESTSNALNSAPLKRVGIVWVSRSLPSGGGGGGGGGGIGGGGGGASAACRATAAGGQIEGQSACTEAASAAAAARERDPAGSSGSSGSGEWEPLELRLPGGEQWARRHTHILFAFPPDHAFTSYMLKPTVAASNAQQQRAAAAPAFMNTLGGGGSGGGWQ
eukprot:SAG22_NODE_73_length_22318_cov_47.105315_10_plen_606_part_00